MSGSLCSGISWHNFSQESSQNCSHFVAIQFAVWASDWVKEGVHRQKANRVSCCLELYNVYGWDASERFWTERWQDWVLEHGLKSCEEIDEEDVHFDKSNKTLKEAQPKDVIFSKPVLPVVFQCDDCVVQLSHLVSKGIAARAFSSRFSRRSFVKAPD